MGAVPPGAIIRIRLFSVSATKTLPWASTETLRGAEEGRGGGAAVAGLAVGAGAGDGGDVAVRGHLAHAAVGGVRDEEAPVGAEGEAVRVVQLGSRGPAPVPAEAALPAGAGDDVDDAGGGGPLADDGVAGVGEVDRPVRPHLDLRGLEELGAVPVLAVAVVAVGPGAGDGEDVAAGVDPAEAAVEGVRDVDGAVRGDGHPAGRVEGLVAGWAPLGAIPGGAQEVGPPGAGEAAELPVLDAEDHVPPAVGDVEGAVRAQGQAGGPAQGDGGGGPGVVVEEPAPVAGAGDDVGEAPVGLDATHHGAVGVGDQEGPVRRGQDVPGVHQLGAAGVAGVAHEGAGDAVVEGVDVVGVGHPQDALVALVEDVEVAVAGHRHVAGVAHRRAEGPLPVRGAAVPGDEGPGVEAGGAGARLRGVEGVGPDAHPADGVDAVDGAVRGVGEVPQLLPRAPRAGEVEDLVDHALGGQPAHDVVLLVGDVDAPVRRRRDAQGAVEAGAGGVPVGRGAGEARLDAEAGAVVVQAGGEVGLELPVAGVRESLAVSGAPAPGDGEEVAGVVHQLDALVVAVGEDHLPGGQHGDPHRAVQGGVLRPLALA